MLTVRALTLSLLLSLAFPAAAQAETSKRNWTCAYDQTPLIVEVPFPDSRETVAMCVGIGSCKFKLGGETYRDLFSYCLAVDGECPDANACTEASRKIKARGSKKHRMTPKK